MYDFKYPDILLLPSLPASFPHSVYDDSRSWYQELVNMEIETEKLEIKYLQNATLSTKDLVFLDPILDDSEA